MTVSEIKKMIENTEYNFYGLRADDAEYESGDIANRSHQLYQDPDFDECGELLYPYIEDGPYSGFYDAGELNGTCAVKFDPYDDDSIQSAIDTVSSYCGDRVYIIAGDDAYNGNDVDEIIIEDAEVIGEVK